VAERYDVIVVGLGAMGGAAALHLARRGQRVLGLEQFTMAHDRGSSHGLSRIIRQAYFEDPAYVPLVLRAYELWDELSRASGGESLMQTTGALMIGPADSELVVGSLRSAEQWGLDHEVLDAAGIHRRFPTFTPTSEMVALYEPQAGLLMPEAGVSTQLQLAARAGADLRFCEPVVRWDADASGGAVSVTTAAGVARAGRLVVCPGAWSPQLLADLGVPISVERRVQFWFRPVGDDVDPFLSDRHPAWIWDDGDGLPYGIPAFGLPDVKVAWHRRGGPCTPDTVDRAVSETETEAIAEAVRRLVPRLPGRFVRAKACMYTNTPDEHFVIGRHPGHPQVVVACGFCGHGFKFAPVVGEIVADLVVSGATAHPIGLFDPARFG